MRLCFKEFTESPDNMESITLRDCPFSASIKYREAAHRLRAWFTSISFGGAYAGEWPAGLAVLKVNGSNWSGLQANPLLISYSNVQCSLST